MIWFTWRQFRIQTWITIGALATVGVFLVIFARSIEDMYTAANVAACQGDCTAVIDNFLSQFQASNHTIYDLAQMMVYAVPALIGVFWGAPLIARELEAGTHRLAWNQSVTRTRWLATKLVIVGGAAAVSAGLLSWAVTTSSYLIDDATGDRITPLFYGARGIVPIGYAIFAFTLGVTLGMLIRRTVPAMAATLAIYSFAAYSIQEWIRERLVSASHVLNPLDVSSPHTVTIGQDITIMTVGVPDNLPDAWVLSNQTITDTGQVFTMPADSQHCGLGASAQACDQWLGSLGLRQDLTYHPADHFWPLQWTETGVLLALAGLLAGFCFWWTRRRLT
jgi:ABC-type transport system involved in multi-copper enzyme maturation permease subunit